MELDKLSRQLRAELLELDVDAVERAHRTQESPGSKGAADALPGLLLLTLSNSTVLLALVGVLGAWVKRGKNRTVRIRLGEDMIEVGRAATEEQGNLVASWIDWHERH